MRWQTVGQMGVLVAVFHGAGWADGGEGSLVQLIFGVTFKITKVTADLSCTTFRTFEEGRRRDIRHVNEEATQFAQNNFELLQRDIASGDGEYVRTFVGLLVPKGNPEMIRRLLKDHYRDLFPRENTTPDQFLHHLSDFLEQHANLL